MIFISAPILGWNIYQGDWGGVGLTIILNGMAFVSYFAALNENEIKHIKKSISLGQRENNILKHEFKIRENLIESEKIMKKANDYLKKNKDLRKELETDIGKARENIRFLRQWEDELNEKTNKANTNRREDYEKDKRGNL